MRGFDLLDFEFLCSQYAELLVEPAELREQLAVVQREDASALEWQALEDADRKRATPSFMICTLSGM